jgi:hypothetical protein
LLRCDRRGTAGAHRLAHVARAAAPRRVAIDPPLMTDLLRGDMWRPDALGILGRFVGVEPTGAHRAEEVAAPRLAAKLGLVERLRLKGQPGPTCSVLLVSLPVQTGRGRGRLGSAYLDAASGPTAASGWFALF